MPNLPTLATARYIVDAYRKDDFNNFIFYGTPRIGKSALAIKAMGQAIEYLWGEDIYKLSGSSGQRRAPVCQRYMGWDPGDNVERWLTIDERIACYTWDDAGYWLFSLNWTDPLLITVQQYMNVIGTDINTFMMTTPDPDWILSKIATIPGTIRIKVIKRDGGRSDAPSKLFARRAIGYKPYRSPDLKKTGVNKVIEDDYSCKLPDEFYFQWYKPTREFYAQAAKLAMREELRRRAEKRERTEKRRRKKDKGSGSDK